MPKRNGAADKNFKIQNFQFDDGTEFEDKTISNTKKSPNGSLIQWMELEGISEPVVEGINEQENDQENEDLPQAIQETESSILDEAREEATTIIASANKKADDIKAEAEKEILQAIEEGKKEGYDVGFKEGEIAGEAQSREAYVNMMKDATKEFLYDLKNILESIGAQKQHFAKKYFNEICGLAMTVAEKIIHVSLKSSGQVIEKMVIAATEKSIDKQWVTVHISDFDEKILIECNTDILKAVEHISPKLKLEIVPEGKSGTCIIEFPDQIIDASVETQMENIKDFIEHHNMNEDI